MSGKEDTLAKHELSIHHPIILPGDHNLTGITISTEHVPLLHTGPTPAATLLARQFCILEGRREYALLGDNVLFVR